MRVDGCDSEGCVGPDDESEMAIGADACAAAECEAKTGAGVGPETGIGADRYAGGGKGVGGRVGGVVGDGGGFATPAIACSSGTGGSVKAGCAGRAGSDP